MLLINGHPIWSILNFEYWLFNILADNISQTSLTRMAVEMSTSRSSSWGWAPLAAMWTTLRNWGEMSYWGLVKTHCPTCPRFTATLWKLQVCFSNLWHWRRWLHITGGTLHGDETQTFLVKNRKLSDLRCCRWWWGTTWRRSSCTAWSTGELNLDICLLVVSHHHQDPRLCWQGHGREDKFRGVWEHHRQAGRVHPQEDGGASVIKQ